MSIDVERLYKLLPAIYRIRDVEGSDPSNPEAQNGILKELLTVISEQIAILDENLDQLYDDQFIETCAEWVIPYIGDLVGSQGIIYFEDAPFSQRSQVAKTIAYRRRKGTAAILEELAADVTGWRANVVEYFQLLATTQYLNHLRPENLSYTSLRKKEWLEDIHTPFDKIARSVEIRNIERNRGKYNIPNIGLFLWRIQSYQLTNSQAYKVDDRRFTFDALGRNVHLYNFPETEESITHLAEPINVPMPAKLSEWNRNPDKYYGEYALSGTNACDESEQDTSLQKSILLVKNGVKVLPNEGETVSDILCFCDLSDVNGTGPGWSNMPTNKIAIDPVLGRVAFPPTSLPEDIDLEVTYCYGFSAEIGGGPYARLQTFSPELNTTIQIPNDAATITDGLNQLGNKSGVIEITDSHCHYINSPIIVPSSAKIEIRGSEGCRPVLIIDGSNNELLITGGENAEISFNGLLICGGTIHVPSNVSESNDLHAIEFTHCTLTPGITPFDPVLSSPLASEAIRLFVGSDAEVTITKSIVGGMRIDEGAQTFITDSILDARENTMLAYGGYMDTEYGAPLTVRNSTILGRVKTTMMNLVSNSILYSESESWEEPPIMTERLQEGCVRYSYFPLNSRLPKSYNCQPQNEADARRIKPVFNSLRYGDPKYCQLSLHTASEIRQGAENDMEMGVFYHLYQPLREYNLITRLNEYLRFGMEAGIFYGS